MMYKSVLYVYRRQEQQHQQIKYTNQTAPTKRVWCAVYKSLPRIFIGLGLEWIFSIFGWNFFMFGREIVKNISD